MSKNKSVFSLGSVNYNGGNYVVVVYGEITDKKVNEGYALKKIEYNKDVSLIREITNNYEYILPNSNNAKARTREFNMGFAICNLNYDKYNETEAIKICKRRFAKYPLSTQNLRFLNLDIAKAIVDNEVSYICNNIYKFLPKLKENMNNYSYTEENNNEMSEKSTSASTDSTETVYWDEKLKEWSDKLTNDNVNKEAEYITQIINEYIKNSSYENIFYDINKIIESFKNKNN